VADLRRRIVSGGGKRKPETFAFLGFTHCCGKTRRGGSTVLRRTSAKRKRAKLMTLKQELRRRLHARIGEVGAWLGSVVRGHYQYYGVPHNSAALARFRFAVVGVGTRRSADAVNGARCRGTV